MPMIRVGSENGGQEAGNALNFAHKALNNVFFFRTNLGPYFKRLKFFSIVLRVSGKNKDFGGEGPEFLRKPGGKDFYTVDLTIPEYRWRGVGFDELKAYVIEGVRQCFELCVEKASISRELLDEGRLRSDFESGIQEILNANSEDDLFHLSKGKDILDAMIAKAEETGQPIDKVQFMKNMQEGIF